jgi:hypothetical protein
VTGSSTTTGSTTGSTTGTTPSGDPTTWYARTHRTTRRCRDRSKRGSV